MFVSVPISNTVPTINPLNAELNPICHMLALLGGATIVVVSRLRVNIGLKLFSPANAPFYKHIEC
jgi:hypothetical protein